METKVVRCVANSEIEYLCNFWAETAWKLAAALNDIEGVTLIFQRPYPVIPLKQKLQGFFLRDWL